MCAERVMTLTSRYPVTYTEVEGEVSVQQWRTILVDNVSGCNAPEMTQPSLFVRGENRKRQREKGRGWEQITDIRASVFSFIVIMWWLLANPHNRSFWRITTESQDKCRDYYTEPNSTESSIWYINSLKELFKGRETEPAVKVYKPAAQIIKAWHLHGRNK